MDPDANLARQRELAARLLSPSTDAESTNRAMRDAVELAELVIALDEWRKSGGFDPYH